MLRIAPVIANRMSVSIVILWVVTRLVLCDSKERDSSENTDDAAGFADRITFTHAHHGYIAC